LAISREEKVNLAQNAPVISPALPSQQYLSPVERTLARLYKELTSRPMVGLLENITMLPIARVGP